jgi:hypothetical protein
MAAKRFSRASPGISRSFGAIVAVAVGLIGWGVATPQAADAAPGDVPGIARVAAVYPLVAPEARTALLTVDSLADYTSATGILTRQLDAVVGEPVAIGIDPLLIASIRVLGNTAPASATEWLDRLDAAPNDTFELTWADSDITVALQAGSATVLQPTSFDFAIDPDRFAAATTATPSPGATPPPVGTAPPLPTSETLLDWDYTLPAVAWPVADTVIGNDLVAIAQSGYSTTLLGSGNVTRTDPSHAHVTIAGSSAVVTDDTISGLLDTTADALTEESWLAASVLLGGSVDAAAAAGDAGGATIVLALDRSSAGIGQRLPQTLQALDALASSDLVTLSSILSGPADDATLVDMPQAPERIATVGPLLVNEQSDAAFAAVAVDPTLITGERRLRLLGTLSSAWTSYPGGWATPVRLFAEDSDELHAAVRIVRSSDITLVADRASLPVTVSNDLDQPVTVLVTITTQSPILRVVQSAVEVTIEPDSQRRAQIPVQSLSNGTARISVSVSTVTGVAVGTPNAVRINVYAGWETPITVAIGILVFLVFAFGVARTILRRRKMRSDAAAGRSPDETVSAEELAHRG